jgi:hypothetical protein
MKANTKKKGNPMKKLVPAAGMLAISATMLATSTYAWFTMSREVSVSGIQMAATVPEDIQISLGELNGGELNKSTGIIKAGNVAGQPVLATDWSNSAVISDYYEIGRLIPASSNDGAEIFFTPDANGVGKTVAGEANYYQATDGLTAENDSASKPYMATLHAAKAENKSITAGSEDTGITKSWLTDTTLTEKYTKGTTWDKTNDDGYYVDIPVWIRSSSDEDITLKVDGYVQPLTTTNKAVSEAEIELYKAVRVAILNGDDGTVVQTNNILPLADAVDWTNSTKTDGLVTTWKYLDNKFAGPSILDSVNYVTRESKTADTLWGVSALGTAAQKADKTGNYTPGTYSQYTAYNSSTATTNVVATIAKPSAGAEYGAAKKLVLRVWLDGEDEQCWNQNAGQDWAITLKFSKIES